MNNLNLLQELFARLKAKSPKFFKVITTISLICTIITGVPETLELLGVALPEVLQPLANKAVAICAGIISFISALTVDTPRATQSVLQNVASGVDPGVAKDGK